MIEWTVEHAAERFGIERLGFLTLTFAEHITDKREAQRRFHSLSTRILQQHYDSRWLCVWERQRSGRLHAHVLLVVPSDIRTGADFDAFARRSYRSANQALRDEWAFWRETAPRYGFGRTELLPIKSHTVAMAAYVGKYLGKDFRTGSDKGVRRYSVGKGLKVATQHHQSAYAAHWRSAVGLLVQALAPRLGVDPHWDDINARMGGNARWIYAYRDELIAISNALRTSPARARDLAYRAAAGESLGSSAGDPP